MSVIIDIDHEAGDLAEYSSTVTDGGDLSADAAAALAGTGYGLKCVLDDTTAIYGQVDQTAPASSKIRIRFYLDPNGLTMANGDTFYILRLQYGATRIVTASLQYTSGTGYQLVLAAGDDGGTQYTLATTTISDAPHYAEVYVQKASGSTANDGIVTWWVDGSQVGAKTDLDLYSYFANMDNLRIGAVTGLDAGTSGTFYLDQLKANDDGGEIGAHSPPAAGTLPPLAMHHYRLRRAA